MPGVLLGHLGNDFDLCAHVLCNLLERREQWLPLIFRIQNNTDYFHSVLDRITREHLENLALTASKFNKNLRVHVVCSGLPYGHGEANDIFYEFFRRAWLSLHPDLAALPVIG